MSPARLLLTALLLLPLLIPDALAAERTAPLRDRLRERALDRVGQRQVADAPPATLLRAGARITAPGRYELRLRHDGLDRMAIIHVPRNWQSTSPTPVLMALHGGGGGALYQADDANYGLITKSEQAGFIAVFPNGISNASSGLLATWNAGHCCGRARDQQVDDVGFLKAVIADLGRRLRIDAARVYATGMSNGGMMAYRLACEASDVFRGIAAVAGTDNTRNCRPATPVPVLHIHARDDDRVLFEGGAGEVFRNEAAAADFTSVPDTIGKWVKLNQAAATPRRVLSVEGAWCDLHDGAAPVKLCVTTDGGHSWPGGNKARGEAPSTAISANDVMWEFFSGLPAARK